MRLGTVLNIGKRTGRSCTGRRGPAALLLVAGVFLAACGTSAGEGSEAPSPTDAAAQSDGIRVVTTTSMLGDVVRAVAGDHAEVEVLIPLGGDPHEFSPSSQQVARLVDADLVVANGLGFENAFEDVIDAAPGANVLEVAPLVDPLPFVEEDHDEDEEGHEEEDEGTDDGHGHGAFDPHIHMDPLRMAAVGDIVADQLEQIDPTVDWAAAAAGFREEMTDLDARIVGILAAVPEDRRVLVSLHDAMGYFADRYGFTVIGTVIPGGSTLAEPSSADLAELVHLVDEQGVSVIFAETTVSPALGEAVAAEAGRPVAVVPLHVDSLGEPGSGADTLAGMLEQNATRIATALGGG